MWVVFPVLVAGKGYSPKTTTKKNKKQQQQQKINKVLHCKNMSVFVMCVKRFDMKCSPICVCRFVQLPSGSLQIHNVSVLDGGSYRCMAAQNFNHLPDQVTNLKWKWSREAVLHVLPGVLSTGSEKNSRKGAVCLSETGMWRKFIFLKVKNWNDVGEVWNGCRLWQSFIN